MAGKAGGVAWLHRYKVTWSGPLIELIGLIELLGDQDSCARYA